MRIDVKCASDCNELVDRIRHTLFATGYDVTRIPHSPKRFPPDDARVLEGLSAAILTRQAEWNSMERILPALKADLLGYQVNAVAALSNARITALFNKYKSQVRARFLEEELDAIRYNAIVFQRITSQYGSVVGFIKHHLSATYYDHSLGCYIRPQDDHLIRSFAHYGGSWKLHCVGLGICCEFFNNIGVDEFKPDVHTTTFLNRVDLDRTKVKVTQTDKDVRGIGIMIAQTLQQARACVDGHVWHFCASGYGEICTENDPRCDECWLHTKQPELCKGFPNRAQTVHNPLQAKARFRECGLTKKQAEKRMRRAGVTQTMIDSVLANY